MGLRAKPLAGCLPETTTPTPAELILQLQSSFFPHELEHVAKTLTDREQLLTQKLSNLKTKNQKLNDELKKKQDELDAVYLKLKTKDEARVCEKQQLSDELKKKQIEIDAMMWLIADYERKFKALEAGDKGLGSEIARKGSMGFSVNLESKEHINCAVESSKEPPRVNDKKGSKTKTEAKLPEIINIDDDGDDDDDHGKQASNKNKRDYYDDDDDEVDFILSTKRSRVSKEMKKEHIDKSAKNSPLLEKDELYGSEPESESGSDIEQVQNLYASSLAKLTKQKGWKSESDMINDFEKDDELCLNAVCALHRQKINVDRSDTLRLNNLARKLIDGDSQKKLKKKASDLKRLDLDHCRMFAKRYSSRLFKIYLDKSDPFFRASKSQE